MGRKDGGLLYLFWGELGLHLTQCRLGEGLPPHQVPSWSIQPCAHNRHGPKIEGGGGAVPLWRGRAGSPSNTMWSGPRPTSVPSGILIHLAIWPQQTWAKIGGFGPFLGRGGSGPHLTQCDLGRGLLPYQMASWSIKRFGHNTWAENWVGTAVPLFGEGELGAHLTQGWLGRGLPPF